MPAKDKKPAPPKAGGAKKKASLGKLPAKKAAAKGKPGQKA